MPTERPRDFLFDSSLDSSLAQKITGVIPLGVIASFEAFYKASLVR